MKVRQFVQEDRWPILAIQERCPLAAPWLEPDYQRLADSRRGLILVAELETVTPPKVVGFAAFHRIIDEAELLNLAVDPDHQHRGVGRALLAEARQRLLEAGTKRVYLEVRLSNKPALRLFSSASFLRHFSHSAGVKGSMAARRTAKSASSPPSAGTFQNFFRASAS